MIVGTAQVAARLLARELDAHPAPGVAALHLDDRGRLLAATCHAAEDGGEALPVRDILAAALRVGAASIVVAHARQGAPEPDPAECAASRRLADAAAAAGVRLMDHLVFAGKECRSFRELGLL
jgi:DNA repair protein RadC